MSIFLTSTSAQQDAKLAPAPDLGLFPAMQAANLNDTHFTLPQNFGGQLNLIVISFAREQQHTVDSWLPAARQLEATHPAFRYYELPTMSRENLFYRWWFNAALRSNTTDKDLRSRILPAYVNKHKFLRSLHVRNDKKVIVILVDQSGRVYWKSDGPYTEQKGQALLAAMPKTQ
ncbi:MAG TPA: hypothetical protein VFN53_06775 [Acidobacteriaceae bacterium]|nr:hypothetical protein [Acidobacteriaceae bacterium]